MAICSPSKSVTYKRLNNLAESFTFSNLPKNAKTGVVINDTVSYVALILAMMRERKVFVNIESLISKDKLSDYVKANEIWGIITDDSELHADDNIKSFQISSFLSQNEVLREINQNLDDEVGGFLSSGSTGTPKVYYRNQYSLISEAILWIMELGLSKESTFFVSKPFSYIGSFVLMYSILYAGGTLYVPNDFSVLKFPDLEIEYAFLSPSDIRYLLNHNVNLNCRNVITMGSPITSQEKISFSKKYGCNLYEMWGNSEGLATITNTYDDPDCESLGRATFTDLIFAVDIKSGIKLGENQIGIIAGITDNGIISNPENDVVLSEDIGYIDDTGGLHLIGRINDVIVFYDNNYFCTLELEAEIRQLQGVIDVAVVLLSNKIYVFVQSNEMMLLTSHISRLFTRMYGKYKKAVDLERVIFVDKIPYSKNGKTDYNKLRSQIAEVTYN